MSYDRRRLRGHHPAACTCVDCKEGRRQRPPAATPAKSENSVWPPRSLSPKLPHPTDCSCSECQEKRRRIRQRPGPAISPAFSPQQEAAKDKERLTTERHWQVAKEQAEEQAREQAQQAPATPLPPTNPPAARRDVAPPNRFHSYVCTCQACGDAREQQHREARAAARPDADTAHVPPPRVQSPPRRQRTGQRRNPPRTLLRIAMPLVIVALLVAGVVWWTSSSSSESGSESATQATDSSGSWFSADCDNERRPRRGGWLRALLC